MSLRDRRYACEVLEARWFAGGMVALTPDELLVAAPDTADALVASLSGDDDEGAASAGAPGFPLGDSDPGGSLDDGLEVNAGDAADTDSVAGGADETVAATPASSDGAVEVAVTVGAPGSGSMRELLFSASASGYTGAPPSSVTIDFDFGDATPGVDYAGMPEGVFSVMIPLSDGAGVARVGYSELDPALLDEPDAAVLAIAEGAAKGEGEVVFVPGEGGGTATMSSGGEQWAAGTPISGSITTSRGPNATVQINAMVSLELQAHDTDMRFNGSFWALHNDDVSSGDSPSDYHIKWAASAGTMIDAYGTTALFFAPDYAVGPSVREVTITATVDDINRGGDVDGFDDAALNVEYKLKVFQITLTLDQGFGGPPAPPDFVSPNYSGPAVQPHYGGGQLGWVTPGDPAGTGGYYGATEIKGTIPVPDRTSGWMWHQDKKGVRSHTEARPEGPVTVFEDGSPWPNWVPDHRPGDNYPWQDTDARHPNVTGPDSREIFFLDAPGAALLPPNADDPPYTAYHFDMDYKTWVNGPDGRASNELEWEVKFDLDGVNGGWVVQPGHVP